jgi:hypothetical protein
MFVKPVGGRLPRLEIFGGRKSVNSTHQKGERLMSIGRFSSPAGSEAFYTVTQTYGLPVVHPELADKVEDVGLVAPEAGYLLTVAFPKLTLDEANRILTETEGPGGGFLDNGSSFGVYSRLNLYAASQRAAALSHMKP